MNIVNYCKECKQKHLKPKDCLSVLITGYCVSCYDYLNSNEHIAHSEGIASEASIWKEVNFELITL